MSVVHQQHARVRGASRRRRDKTVTYRLLAVVVTYTHSPMCNVKAHLCKQGVSILQEHYTKQMSHDSKGLNAFNNKGHASSFV